MSVNQSASAARQMDAIYRHQRLIYDATRRYYLLGRDRLLNELAPPAGGTVLEIGCGTARNLIRAARLYPSARLYGLDVSEEMLETARRKVLLAGVPDRITLAAADATNFSAEPLFAQPAFERVFISYALSMIPPWREAVDQASSALAPGGELHIIDFGDFAGFPALFRRAQHTWLRRFSVTPIDGLPNELAAIAQRLGLNLEVTPLYGGYALLARMRSP
jgi:S-adenosylmethionine-diacylgycerolhomoserine-N-methlytransferase